MTPLRITFKQQYYVCAHHSARSTQVYQVTRSGHEHCDVTEGVLLDITALQADGIKLVTLYDKDLTEGINLLIGKYHLKFIHTKRCMYDVIIVFCLK